MEQSIGAVFADTLAEAGIRFVFGMPGGCTPFLYDGLIDRAGEIRTVLARHEGGAAVMADAHARITGKPALLMGQGAWIGTSGGYGILESYLSGLPMVVVADLSDYFSLPLHGPYQNGSGDYGGFDLPAMLRAMTKFTTVAGNASEFVHGLRLAVKHAVTGRPGPAAVLIKWNVAFEQVDLESVSPRVYPLSGHLRTAPPCISPEDADRVARLLRDAASPLVIAGQGARLSRASVEILELAEFLGAPVATTYLGKSAVAETHDCAVGTMGPIGQSAANRAIARADLILAVGTSLAPENTNWMAADYIRPDRQKIVQIDVEPLRAGWTYPLELGVTSDARLALQAVLRSLRALGRPPAAEERLAALLRAKEDARCFREDTLLSDAVPIAPERVVKAVNDAVGPEDLVVLDGGNNRMWFAHHFRCLAPGQILAGGGVAAVGYGPPAALGAQLTCPDRRVICASGDGGMMMHLYALEMARDLDLPVTFVVLNNACLGNIRDYQPPDRRISTDYSRPDFRKIAEGFGIHAARVEQPAGLDACLREALETKGPALVDVVVDDAAHFRLMTNPKGA